MFITTVLFLKISTTGFGADAILAHAKAWDLVLWTCPRRSTTLWSRWSHGFNLLYFHQKVNTFKTPEMCLYLDSDVWAGCVTIIFAGSFHYFKPVSCWILFCENVAGVLQFPSRVAKVNAFKTPEMRLYFDSDVWSGCLTIIFVGSFSYFMFLTRSNSKVRRK